MSDGAMSDHRARDAHRRTILLARGIHEVVKVRADGKLEMGYFDDLDLALSRFEHDTTYRAGYFSLNPLKELPTGFSLNPEQFKRGNRSQKDWMSRRVWILIDCDPQRPSGTNATAEQFAPGKKMAEEIWDFLVDGHHWPRPLLSVSGNGHHLLFAIELLNDPASEDLIKRLLAGLAARFDNEQCHVDAGMFPANALCRLYGTWNRKDKHTPERPQRQSEILEIPEREIPQMNQSPLLVPDLEPVPQALIESTVAQLPVPQKMTGGPADVELDSDANRKYEWLRSFLNYYDVPILNTRHSGGKLLFDIGCPWENEHGSRSGESSTSVWYVRKFGYGFHCFHRECAAESRDWPKLKAKLNRSGKPPFSRALPKLPEDSTNAAVGNYFRDHCPEFANHMRVITDKKSIGAVFVGTRWVIEDSEILLMKALQPIFDRLRWDMPEPDDPERDYRRILDSHSFRRDTAAQIGFMRDHARFEQLDGDGFLIGLPGGYVFDFRTGQERQMLRADFITRRLRFRPDPTMPTPVWDYFIRSISSANGQPPDQDWIASMTSLIGYCTLGIFTDHVWPLWTGSGRNGKSGLARLMQFILSDFCVTVRFSELVRDDRGGDNTFKRLCFKLLRARVAFVEESGEETGTRRLETSMVKNLTGGGELIGADLYRSEVSGPIRFKMPTLSNFSPRIEPDPAMVGRVRLFPFRAVFNELSFPGCLQESMDCKHAPDILRQRPTMIEELMQLEAPGILHKWLMAGREFAAGNQKMLVPSVIQQAGAQMFRESDLHARFCDERLEFGPELTESSENLISACEWFLKETGVPVVFSMVKLAANLRERKCTESTNVKIAGLRKRGWVGVKLRDRN
ncbi:MAG: hypothetical protein LAN83_00945 [Acidobacteriia bacterium]|nr:hypothetical protein [Terriglobia bacterium]